VPFIYITIIFLYFIFSIAISLAIHKKESCAVRNLPSVSVIVAARNEENVITYCLDSLDNLDYPENLLEIVLVNDRSSDNTGQIMKKFSFEFRNVKILHLNENNSNLSGKSNALNSGADISSGKILFFTDADCEVPRNWIREMLEKMPDNNTIVSGFLFLDKYKNNRFSSLFSRLQSLDWILFCSMGMAAANTGRPLSIFGNNFAVYRKLFMEIGGFGYHPTEDYAFMRKAVKKKDAKVVFSLSLNSGVFTRPVSRINDFISQRKRWAIGTKKRDILSIGLLFFSIIALWASLILTFSGELLYGISGFLLITLSDAVILFKPLSILKKLYLLMDIVLYKLFFAVYTLTILLLSIFNTSVFWKGDKIKE